MVTPEYLRERYWTLANLGLCTKCGKTEPREGCRECLECLAKRRNAMQKARDRKAGRV